MTNNKSLVPLSQEEQKGNSRAEYGTRLIAGLADNLNIVRNKSCCTSMVSHTYRQGYVEHNHAKSIKVGSINS